MPESPGVKTDSPVDRDLPGLLVLDLVLLVALFGFRIIHRQGAIDGIRVIRQCKE